MLGHSDFQVTPRRGELIVFDKLARGLLNHVLLPVPTEKTKGVLVSPTVYGNVLLGPTADDVHDKTDRSTTAAGLDIADGGGRPDHARARGHEVTATYVGLRAATEHRDYQLVVTPGAALRLRRRHPLDRHHRVAGDRRVGARGACASGAGPRGPARPRACGCRTSASSGRAPTRSGELIARDPDYGRIVCFCERVTRGEIDAALRGPDPARGPRRPAPPDACADGPLPGLLLRGRGRIARGGGRGWRSMTDRVIVGGGPSGLAAAIELRELGVSPGDRDRARARGRRHPAPLRSHGLRAARPADRALRARGTRARYRELADGGRRRGRHRDDGHRVGGAAAAEADRSGRPQEVEPPAVVLATGCRERPRSARLVPGSRPAGVMTTATLQQLVHLRGQKVGRRAVIVGAEHVSFSAVATLAHGGASVAGAGHRAAAGTSRCGPSGPARRFATGRRSGPGPRSARSTAPSGSSRSS